MYCLKDNGFIFESFFILMLAMAGSHALFMRCRITGIVNTSLYFLKYNTYFFRECSGSVVECLTRDRMAAGSSLTGVTALLSLSKTHLSYLSTGSTQEDPSRITERFLSGRKESNQTNKQNNTYFALERVKPVL